jgi:hypothetical protein
MHIKPMLLGIATLCLGFATVGGAGGADNTTADRLATHLIGRFDSTKQAASNPQYFEIQLVTCEVPAPALSARALYVEQAVMTALDEPYRQRLYLVEPGTPPDTQAISRVYTFNNPMAYIGRCNDADGAEIAAADVVERTGCDVTMNWTGDHFSGGTTAKECESDLNGASYATSVVDIFEDRIESWDRGYDAEDGQVWGAVAGAYVFDRQTPYGEQP